MFCREQIGLPARVRAHLIRLGYPAAQLTDAQVRALCTALLWRAVVAAASRQGR